MEDDSNLNPHDIFEKYKLESVIKILIKRLKFLFDLFN